MSYTEISSKHVVGRKSYVCEWCGTKIEPKERHLARAYIFEGEFTSGRMHLECEQAMDKSPWDSVADGWITGEQERGEVLG